MQMTCAIGSSRTETWSRDRHLRSALAHALSVMILVIGPSVASSAKPSDVREFGGFPDVHTVASLDDHEFLRSYFRVFAPEDEFRLPTGSVSGRKVVPFGESEALVALLHDGGNGGPNVFVIFREAAHRGVVAEQIRTIGAELDHDVRDLNADGVPEILVQDEVDNLYLARASCLLWPEVYRFTGKSYEKRSMEFPSFYVLDYWPRIVRQVRAEITPPAGYAAAASEAEILTRAKGTFLAQQEVLRRLNAVLQAARVHIFKETGQDPLFKPDAQMSLGSLARVGIDPPAVETDQPASDDAKTAGGAAGHRTIDSPEAAIPRSPEVPAIKLPGEFRGRLRGNSGDGYRNRTSSRQRTGRDAGRDEPDARQSIAAPLAIWLDGSLEDEDELTGTVYDGGAAFMIGAHTDTSGAIAGCFNGTIDEVRVSSVARYGRYRTPDASGNENDGFLKAAAAITDGRFWGTLLGTLLGTYTN